MGNTVTSVPYVDRDFLASRGGGEMSGRMLYVSEKGDSLPHTIPDWLVLV